MRTALWKVKWRGARSLRPCVCSRRLLPGGGAPPRTCTIIAITTTIDHQYTTLNLQQTALTQLLPLLPPPQQQPPPPRPPRTVRTASRCQLATPRLPFIHPRWPPDKLQAPEWPARPSLHVYNSPLCSAAHSRARRRLTTTHARHWGVSNASNEAGARARECMEDGAST